MHIHALAYIFNVVRMFWTCFELNLAALIGDITAVSCCIVCLRKNGASTLSEKR